MKGPIETNACYKEYSIVVLLLSMHARLILKGSFFMIEKKSQFVEIIEIQMKTIVFRKYFTTKIRKKRKGKIILGQKNKKIHYY